VLPLLGLVRLGDPKVAERFDEEHLSVAMDARGHGDRARAALESHHPERRFVGEQHLRDALQGTALHRLGYAPSLVLDGNVVEGCAERYRWFLAEH
jgi:hypothetical protein